MSFLSFLPSHRLHATHRPWIDPLPVQLDLFLHDLPSDTPEAPDLPAAPTPLVGFASDSGEKSEPPPAAASA